MSYPVNVLLEAERRQNELRAANEVERERAKAASAAYFDEYLAYQRALYEASAFRGTVKAMDLAAANIWRGQPRRSAALVAFEGQWRREKRGWKRRHLRISGLDATEQFVRRIRLWRAAGVL